MNNRYTPNSQLVRNGAQRSMSLRLPSLCKPVVWMALFASAFGCDNTAHEEELSNLAVPINAWAADVDTLAGQYSVVMRPAEFWDSVLVVPDLAEGLLWKIDLVTGEKAAFGSLGSGPGEYPRVSWAMKVHPDSVAIVQGNTYMPFPIISVKSGGGRTMRVEGRTLDPQASISTFVSQPRFRYADTLGYLYATVSRFSDDDSEPQWPAAMPLASVPTNPLLRFSVLDGRVDTVGVVPVDLKAPDLETLPNRSRVRVSAGWYSPFNGWITLPDGRSVLANGGSYVLEVVGVDGDLAGPFRVEHPIIPASSNGYEEYLDSARQRSSALMRNTLTRANVTVRPPEQELSFPQKPATLPPLGFSGNRGMQGRGNVVWVPVNVEEPPAREVWDLVNFFARTRLCRVALPSNQRLLLVTTNGAYVSARDEWDLERIVLYRPGAGECARRAYETEPSF